MSRAAVRVRRKRIGRHGEAAGERAVPEETPVAFTFDRKTYAVMMATPDNLEDFAYGFSFSERIIADVDDVRELDVTGNGTGVELRMSLSNPAPNISKAGRGALRGLRVAGCAGSKASRRLLPRRRKLPQR